MVKALILLSPAPAASDFLGDDVFCLRFSALDGWPGDTVSDSRVFDLSDGDGPVDEQRVEQLDCAHFFAFLLIAFEQIEWRSDELLAPDNALRGEVVIDQQILPQQVFESIAAGADVGSDADQF